MMGKGIVAVPLLILTLTLGGAFCFSGAGLNLGLRRHQRPGHVLRAHSNLQLALALLRQGSSLSFNSADTWRNEGLSDSTRPLQAQYASTAEAAQLVPFPGAAKIVTNVVSSKVVGAQVSAYLELQLETKLGVSVHDITPAIREAITDLGITDGTATVLSRHTTTAVVLNEHESRLIDDMRQFFRKLAPPDEPYLHNDIHLRPATADDLRRVGPTWGADLDGWRAQEPKNCHSHLLSLLLGNTLAIPIVRGDLAIGTWQSVMMVELDGARRRTVGVQVMGFR